MRIRPVEHHYTAVDGTVYFLNGWLSSFARFPFIIETGGPTTYRYDTREHYFQACKAGVTEALQAGGGRRLGQRPKQPEKRERYLRAGSVSLGPYSASCTWPGYSERATTTGRLHCQRTSTRGIAVTTDSLWTGATAISTTCCASGAGAKWSRKSHLWPPTARNSSRAWRRKAKTRGPNRSPTQDHENG